LAVAGPCPTSTLVRSFPGKPGRSLSATSDPFGSFSLAEKKYKFYGKTICVFVHLFYFYYFPEKYLKKKSISKIFQQTKNYSLLVSLHKYYPG